MNILFVNYEYPPLGGGGGVAMKEIAEQLAVRGHQVGVLTSSMERNGLLSRELVELFGRRVYTRNAESVATTTSLIEFLRPLKKNELDWIESFKPDLVNSHFTLPSGWVGGSIAKRFKVPHVLSVHGGDIYDPTKHMAPNNNALVRHIVRRICTSADHIVAQSTDIQERTKELCQRQDIAKIALPVAFTAGDRTNLSDDQPHIVFIGRLVKRKNLRALVRAFSEVVSEQQDARPIPHLTIVGDGPEKPVLESIIQEHHLSDHVTLAGWVSEEEKRQILANADVYTQTSFHEGFGITLVEAMRSRLPLVVTTAGGQQDFLSEQSGVLLESGAKDDIRAGLLKALSWSHEERARIGAYNEERSNAFLPERIAEEYELLFSAACTEQAAA